MAARLPAIPWWVGLLVLTMAGCHRTPSGDSTDNPPVVVVTSAVERDVTDFEDMTGRVAAIASVDVRARVNGYLVATPFTEGAEVKTNHVLFEIDPRPYQAQLDNAQATVNLNEARLRLATADNQRAKQIRARDPGAISVQDLDKYQAAEDEAAAALAAAKATLETCKLNLSFTKVLSPIDGQVNRYNMTPGNLVTQDTTLLTTVVSQDPMHVYFDLDEPALLRILRYLRGSKDSPKPLVEKRVPALLGLADEQGYPHAGHLNFASNQVDASTGTMSVRGVFPNPASPSGVRLLRPGMFVRVRMPMGMPYKAVLVPDRALGSDQGEKYLLVVDDQSVVEYRSTLR